MMAADPGIISTNGRLAEGELPWPIRKASTKPIRKVVEEFQRIADDGRGEDL